jgi:hypothetical protein
MPRADSSSLVESPVTLVVPLLVYWLAPVGLPVNGGQVGSAVATFAPIGPDNIRASLQGGLYIAKTSRSSGWASPAQRLTQQLPRRHQSAALAFSLDARSRPLDFAPFAASVDAGALHIQVAAN